MKSYEETFRRISQESKVLEKLTGVLNKLSRKNNGLETLHRLYLDIFEQESSMTLETLTSTFGSVTETPVDLKNQLYHNVYIFKENFKVITRLLIEEVCATLLGNLDKVWSDDGQDVISKTGILDVSGSQNRRKLKKNDKKGSKIKIKSKILIPKIILERSENEEESWTEDIDNQNLTKTDPNLSLDSLKENNNDLKIEIKNDEGSPTYSSQQAVFSGYFSPSNDNSIREIIQEHHKPKKITPSQDQENNVSMPSLNPFVEKEVINLMNPDISMDPIPHSKKNKVPRSKKSGKRHRSKKSVNSAHHRSQKIGNKEKSGVNKSLLDTPKSGRNSASSTPKGAKLKMRGLSLQDWDKNLVAEGTPIKQNNKKGKTIRHARKDVAGKGVFEYFPEQFLKSKEPGEQRQGKQMEMNIKGEILMEQGGDNDDNQIEKTTNENQNEINKDLQAKDNKIGLQSYIKPQISKNSDKNYKRGQNKNSHKSKIRKKNTKTTLNQTPDSSLNNSTLNRASSKESRSRNEVSSIKNLRSFEMSRIYDHHLKYKFSSKKNPDLDLKKSSKP